MRVDLCWVDDKTTPGRMKVKSFDTVGSARRYFKHLDIDSGVWWAFLRTFDKHTWRTYETLKPKRRETT